MSDIYHHKQIGTVIIVSMIIAEILCLVSFALAGITLIGALVAIVLLVSLSFFGTLTVLIDEKYLIIKFGNGLIGKKFLLMSVTSARKVRNPWWYGWGIHFTPRGLLYNVSGFDAVEITLKTGKIFRIGTDDPVGLEQALKRKYN